MKLDKVEKLSCDVLVIGGGGAGLRSAIAAASSGARVLIVSKAKIGRSTNTYISKSARKRGSSRPWRVCAETGPGHPSRHPGT